MGVGEVRGHGAWAWARIGNSDHIAMRRNDTLLKSTDYMEAGAQGDRRREIKSDAKCDADGGGNRLSLLPGRGEIKTPQRIALSCVRMHGIDKR